ncbi:F-box protein At1g67340-like [Curcuma longa]|uniref:F-box protein At1g67340-like n=1 Tax=Curcuma longa TaxID=136217 RepID=UPI003D9EEBE7
MGVAGGGVDAGRKRTRAAEKGDLFDVLPDELVVAVLCKLSASAARPADLVAVFVVCRRLNRLGLDPLVLSRASAESLAVRAKSWSDFSHRYLKRCADSGNLEARYILGMIRFYCLRNRKSGLSLIAQAAIENHAPALFSLAVIQFNGSGKSKIDKDPEAGVALCARAASLGYVDAMRVLGHCLQDGYGVRRNLAEGRRFLLLANAREFAAFLHSSSSSPLHRHANRRCSLLKDLDLWMRSTPPPEPHPANRFLAEWFTARSEVLNGEELSLCSNGGCGRLETRRHEFWLCAACSIVRYCSRACQATHWRSSHKAECVPFEQWLDATAAAAAVPVEDEAPMDGGAGVDGLVLD